MDFINYFAIIILILTVFGMVLLFIKTSMLDVELDKITRLLENILGRVHVLEEEIDNGKEKM